MEKVAIPEARNMKIYVDKLNCLLQDKGPDDIQTIKYSTQIKRVRYCVQKITQHIKNIDWFIYDTKIKVYPILDADKLDVLNAFKDRDADRIENILETLSFITVNRYSKRERKMNRHCRIAPAEIQRFISDITGHFIIKAYNNEYIEYAYGYGGLIEQWLCIKDTTDYDHNMYEDIYAYLEGNSRYETFEMNPESILYEIDKCKFTSFDEGFKDNRDSYIECYEIPQDQREIIEELMEEEQFDAMEVLARDLPIVSISMRDNESKDYFPEAKYIPYFLVKVYAYDPYNIYTDSYGIGTFGKIEDWMEG